MKHYIAIEAKFHGPTNNTGSRFSLTLPRWENKRIYCSWEYANSYLTGQVEAWLRDNKIPCDSFAETKSGYVYFVDFSHFERLSPIFKIPQVIA